MKIEQQNNFQECGICCIAMLLSYYNDENISKNDVHNICNISPEGLSLFDIEKLGSQNNLLLESYNCNWEDIFNQKPKNPFILVVKNNVGLHYVVGKYKNKKIYIFDPLQKNRKKYTLSNKLENFFNIYISSEKGNIELNKNKIIVDKQFIKHFSLVYFFKIFIFSIFALLFNIFNSSLMSILFNKIYDKDRTIILSLCLVVIIVILLNSLFKYLMSLIRQKHIMKTYLIYLDNFTEYFSKKHLYFYKSISKSFFTNYYSILKNYLTFYIDFYVELSINFLMLFISVIIIFIINPWLLIIVLFINVTNFIFKWIYKNHTIKKEQIDITKYELIN